MKVKNIVGALAVLPAVLFCSFGGVKTSAKAETALPVYENFDGYDTVKARDGERDALTQMLGWSKNMAGFVAEIGEPVGSNEGDSLKITLKNNTQTNAWTNGTMVADKLDQTGSKYVRVSVRNLSEGPRELIVYVTDIAEDTVEENKNNPLANGAFRDDGQEHWAIKWNKAAVLEEFDGEKTAVKSTLGQSVSIPDGFEGYLYLPLNEETLEQPAWWFEENSPYRNDKIDLNRLFGVSFGFVEGDGTTSSYDQTTWTVFELDDVCFGKDDSIDAFIKESGKQAADTAADAIRPVDDTITIDYEGEKVILSEELTAKALKDKFSLKSGYTVVVKKNSEELTDDQKIGEGCVLVFDGANGNFVYTIELPKTDEKPVEAPRQSGGCAGSITSAAFSSLMGLAAVAVLKRKKEN